VASAPSNAPNQSALAYIIACIAPKPATARRFCASRVSRRRVSSSASRSRGQRAVADAPERLDDPRERQRLCVEHDPRPPRARVDADVDDPGKATERLLDQPAASGAVHAVDQHDRLAAAVDERAHEVARQLGPQESRRIRLRLAEIRRSAGRARAQPIVVGQSQIRDPFRHGAAAVAAHGVPDTGNVRLRRIRRQRLAAMPAGRGHAITRSRS
jgi:hypothetical protein